VTNSGVAVKTKDEQMLTFL